MKKVVGISVTNKGGYWVYSSEKLSEQQGLGERTASYHLNAEAMNEALLQAGLKSAGELIGRTVGFDAREQFASSMLVFPAATGTVKVKMPE